MEKGKKMTLYQPDYYDKFQCTASACPMTCCMQWRIAVDDETILRWPQDWKKQVKEVEEGYVIRLKRDGMCPFLNEEKLCKIVLKAGDQEISHTCQTFPREEHRYNGRIERCLTPGCPAVLDLMWKQDDFHIQEREIQGNKIQEKEIHGQEIRGQKVKEEAPNEEICELNPILFEIRDWFLEIVNDRKLPLNTALEICFLIAVDLYELEQKGILEKEFMHYKNVTNIQKIREAIGTNDQMTEDRLEEYNLLFLDISEIYRKQKIYADFLVPLAKEAEKLDCRKIEYWSEFEPKLAPWKEHLRKLFAEEISSAVITPGTEHVLDMLVKLEWMAMEYAVLLQVLFLQGNTGEITYEKLRESVCVIFRMMGYADDDICEYMENCFDQVIWPWKYYALLV